MLRKKSIKAVKQWVRNCKMPRTMSNKRQKMQSNMSVIKHKGQNNMQVKNFKMLNNMLLISMRIWNNLPKQLMKRPTENTERQRGKQAKRLMILKRRQDRNMTRQKIMWKTRLKKRQMHTNQPSRKQEENMRKWKTRLERCMMMLKIKHTSRREKSKEKLEKLDRQLSNLYPVRVHKGKVPNQRKRKLFYKPLKNWSRIL